MGKCSLKEAETEQRQREENVVKRTLRYEVYIVTDAKVNRLEEQVNRGINRYREGGK